MKPQIRKKTTLDGIDRDILRNLYRSQRNLSGRQIAQRVSLSPSAIRPRLINLQTQGIIKPIKIQQPRIFKRDFEIKATKKIVTRNMRPPRSIFWGIDLK